MFILKKGRKRSRFFIYTVPVFFLTFTTCFGLLAMGLSSGFLNLKFIRSWVVRQGVLDTCSTRATYMILKNTGN